MGEENGLTPGETEPWTAIGYPADVAEVVAGELNGRGDARPGSRHRPPSRRHLERREPHSPAAPAYKYEAGVSGPPQYTAEGPYLPDGEPRYLPSVSAEELSDASVPPPRETSALPESVRGSVPSSIPRGFVTSPVDVSAAEAVSHRTLHNTRDAHLDAEEADSESEGYRAAPPVAYSE